MECECRLTGYPRPNHIEYCPLHKSAPDLYEALRFLVIFYTANLGSDHEFTRTITPAKTEVLDCWKDAKQALAKVKNEVQNKVQS